MSVSLRCVVNCVALVSGLPLIHTVYAQDTVPLLVRVEDRGRVGPRNRVVVRDPRTGQDREIYRSKGHIPNELAVSTNGGYLAFTEGVGSSGVPKQQLTIIDFSGHVVRVLGATAIPGARGIREYRWCGSEKVAIVTGAVGEVDTFVPESVFVVGVRSSTQERMEGLWRPLQIYWAAFDSSLYIKRAPPPEAQGQPGPVNWPVDRYHVPSGRLSATTRRGVFFSPDGTYYFDTGVHETWETFRLYRAVDNQDVTATLDLPAEQIRSGPEFGWMPGAGHVLLFIERPPRPERQPGEPRLPPRLMDRNTPQLYPDRWNLAVDAESGRVIDRFQGDLGAGWKTNAPALPVERRTGVDLLPARRP